MQTDFNRLSLEANPPFAVKAERRIANRLAPSLQTRTVFVFQTGSIQCIPSLFSQTNLPNYTEAPFFRCFADRGSRREHGQGERSTANSLIDQFQASAGAAAGGESVWGILESLIGGLEAPPDWAAEHDHYLYGTPKHESG
jgi:hypothetical protein